MLDIRIACSHLCTLYITNICLGTFSEFFKFHKKFKFSITIRDFLPKLLIPYWRLRVFLTSILDDYGIIGKLVSVFNATNFLKLENIYKVLWCLIIKTKLVKEPEKGPILSFSKFLTGFYQFIANFSYFYRTSSMPSIWLNQLNRPVQFLKLCFDVILNFWKMLFWCYYWLSNSLLNRYFDVMSLY